MPGGTIKRLVRDRGFGFIRDDGGQEWFFHRSSVQGSFDQLNEGHASASTKSPRPRGRAPATFAAKAERRDRTSGSLRIGFRRDQLFSSTSTARLCSPAAPAAGHGARVRGVFGIPDALAGIPIARPDRHLDRRRAGRRARHRRATADTLDAFRDVYLTPSRARDRAARAAQGRHARRPAAARRLRPRDDVFLALLTGNYESGRAREARILRPVAVLPLRRVWRRRARSQRLLLEGAGARAGVRRTGGRTRRRRDRRRHAARRRGGAWPVAPGRSLSRPAVTTSTPCASGADVVLRI